MILETYNSQSDNSAIFSYRRLRPLVIRRVRVERRFRFSLQSLRLILWRKVLHAKFNLNLGCTECARRCFGRSKKSTFSVPRRPREKGRLAFAVTFGRDPSERTTRVVTKGNDDHCYIQLT